MGDSVPARLAGDKTSAESAMLAVCMSDITSPVNVAFLMPHALVSKSSVSISLQEHQDVLPLNKHRATSVLIAVTLLCC